MGKISVILTIRYPNYDDDNKYETKTDVLYNDDDQTLIDWVSDNIAEFFDDEGIVYDFDNYQEFLLKYYPNDEPDATPPFRVSYFDIRREKWRYLMDEFIEKIMDNFDDLDNIDFDEDEDNSGYYE